MTTTHRRPARLLARLAAGLLPLLAVPALAAGADAPLIPYEKFKLDNGLTVLVHTDRKAPVVAVNVWYHVGSKNETAGQDRLCPPVRAPDVPGHGELQRRVLQAVRAGRRHRPERHDQLRPHQLLPERADHRARHGAVDGVRPHGPPARGGRARSASTSSAAWCRTRSARARTSPTGACSSRCCAPASRRAIRTAGRPSARWRTSTPPSLDDVQELVPHLLRRRTMRCWCWPATSTWRRRKEKAQQYFGAHPGRPGVDAARHVDRTAHRQPRAK